MSSEHPLPPQEPIPHWAELDAWMAANWPGGTAALFDGSYLRIVMHSEGLAWVKQKVSEYMAGFPPGTDIQSAFTGPHDAGWWIATQATKKPLNLAEYLNAPDNRKNGVLKNAPDVLARLLTTGVDWDGTQVVSDDAAYRDEELVTRSARGQFLVKTGRYPLVAEDLVLYASVRGGIDLRFVKPDFGQPKATLQDWLNNQKLNDK